jgi:hypothetical protein
LLDILDPRLASLAETDRGHTGPFQQLERPIHPSAIALLARIGHQQSSGAQLASQSSEPLPAADAEHHLSYVQKIERFNHGSALPGVFFEYTVVKNVFKPYKSTVDGT